MLAAVITARNNKEAINDIKKAKDADLIELRIDYIKSFDCNLIKKIKKI